MNDTNDNGEESFFSGGERKIENECGLVYLFCGDYRVVEKSAAALSSLE